MSIILGISSSHDASAALYQDGELVAAIAEERLSRIKCDGSKLPQLAIDEVLHIAGLTRRDVDIIALTLGMFPEQYFRRPNALKELERKASGLRRRLAGRPPKLIWGASVQKEALAAGKDVRALFRDSLFLRNEGFRPNACIRFYDHHLVHAVLAGHFSGYDDCTVVTLDGVGDRDQFQTAWKYVAGELKMLGESSGVGNSAGFFYEYVTELLGFRPLRHEGKVLGLAAYGDPSVLYDEFHKALRLSEDGLHLESDFGAVSNPKSARYAYLKNLIQAHTREEVAAAAQKILEDAVTPLVRNMVARTGLHRVALNGGVFANVKLNQRIAALPEVESLFVFPGMSDTGNSVGAALLALNENRPGHLKNNLPLRDVYLGPDASEAEIERELQRVGASYSRLDNDALIDRTARAIHEGLVVGWFQGRMEFGPRALGHRSMIGRPTEAGINKALNDRLERTEFMPFAPSVLDEAADEIFLGVDKARHAAEFMTVTFDVKPEWCSRIPAVVHVDGTARPQLVRKDRNPLYHQVISRYRELSGIPVVLNTSFNVHEEPIVCKPQEAIRAVHEDRIDALAIGPFWVDNPRRAIFR